MFVMSHLSLMLQLLEEPEVLVYKYHEDIQSTGDSWESESSPWPGSPQSWPHWI